MNFDAVVSRLEELLLLRLRQQETLAWGSGHFTEVEVVSLRHAEFIHAIGIRCEPTWATGNCESLLFGAVVANVKRLTVSATIHWTETFDAYSGSGYLIVEVRPVYLPISDEREISRFAVSWNRLAKHFSRIARHGKPSPRFVRWLRGATADTFGITKSDNN